MSITINLSLRTLSKNTAKYSQNLQGPKMHVLQPKHIKLKPEEAKILLTKLSVTPSQLPKIKKHDPALPKDAKVGDIIKIERKTEFGKVLYYRTVIP